MMRVVLSAVGIGIVLGVIVGVGVGKFHASFYSSWTPENEANKGSLFAETSPTPAVADAPDDEPPTPTKKAAKGPRVKVDELAFDFGILEKSPSTEKGEHPFYIENVGDADLTLADGGKGCFCTSFTISKTTVKPGEKATVLFKWDGARSGGVFNQGVRVLTNDPDQKEITFAVKGLYTSPVISMPSELAFNNATTTNETKRVFRLFGFEHNDDGSPLDLEISEAQLTDTEHFELELTKDSIENMTEDEKNNRLLQFATSVYNGSVTLKPGMTQGAFQELLRLRLNSPKTPIVEIPVHGSVMGREIKVLGPLYDERETGTLRLDSVNQTQGKSTTLRFLVFEPLPCNEKTVFVKSVRPDWIHVDFTYPDEELQRTMKVRQVEATVEVPANSPQGAFMGPGKDQLGEIVLQFGEDDATAQKVVVPVRFAVVP